MRAPRLVFLALLAASAVALGAVERLFPLPLPGARLGLGNALVLLALLLFGVKDAALVLAVKSLLAALLFAGPASLLYSLTGGLLALAAMTLARRFSQVSVAGVSLAGAAAHNVGQVSVAALLTATPELFTYLAPLMLVGVLTGLATGAAANWALGPLRAFLAHRKEE